MYEIEASQVQREAYISNRTVTTLGMCMLDKYACSACAETITLT